MHLEHLGSNTDVWKNTWFPKLAMQRAAGNLQNSLNRPKDISFVIDQLVRLNQQHAGRFYHRLDLKHIGATGHSFGAYSVLAIAGEVFPLGFGRQTTFADSRVIAVIPMSAPVPKKAVNYSRAFGSISIPCLHMTGTLDDSLINDTKSAQRRIPYDYARHSDQYLLTFNGGDHMVFSGRGDKSAFPANRCIVPGLYQDELIGFLECLPEKMMLRQNNGCLRMVSNRR